MKVSNLLFLFLFVGSSFFSFAQQSHEWKTATSNGYTYKYVTNDPMKARFYTLKNGLSVILTENHKEPRIAVNIAVRAGSNTDPKDHTGLAHYLEHLLFKGTDKFGTLDWQKEKPYIDSITNLYESYTKMTDPEERKKTYKEIDRLSNAASHYSIANEYDKLMSNMGSQGTNAHTSVEETVYKEDIPSNVVDKFLAVQAERFRKPILRIFHTELEAVYEEKNRSMDNDAAKMYEGMNYYLFPTHNYGQQTTIGTVEHLKNPSIKAIQAYYDKYYVPNNMAMIMAGDFNSDEMIKKIDQAFSYMKEKPVQLYNPAPEKPMSGIIEKDIFGPSAENMRIGYRTPAQGTRDALVLDLISSLLSNGSAGLLDIELNKKQKVQGAQSGIIQMKDYGVFILLASPKEGQTLEELKPLLLGELNKIKTGNFDPSLVKAIVANYKLDDLKAMDDNSSRLGSLMKSYIFSKGDNWKGVVSSNDDMAKISKEEIMKVANKYLGDNYVVLYKRKGEDKSIVKVDKPAITPVETNAGKESPFVLAIAKMPVSEIKPQWLDFDKDITKGKAGIADILYVQNKENDLFNLYYRFDVGSYNDPYLSYAAAYLQFLSTDKYSAEQLSKMFYELACSYSINVSSENTTIVISGLQENFDKAVALFEEVMANCKPDEEALTQLKNRFMKARANAKLNKGAIASGLRSWATYGKSNPFNNVLTDSQLQGIKSTDLVNALHNLMNYKHTIIYYGPQPLNQFASNITAKHKLPTAFTAAPAKKEFTYQTQDKNKVLFADYDMVQAEIYWVRNIKPYDFSQEATVDVFNNYFGGGMGSIVFQTIRESKALAYSTGAMYSIPSKKEDQFTMTAYVGAQADKMNEAIAGMNELLNVLPQAESNFKLAVEGVKQDIATQRIVKDGVIFYYLNAEKKGFKEDMRKSIFEAVNKITLKDIENLHKSDVSQKPYTYSIVASDKKINMEDLQKIGEVQKLTLQEIFGY